LLKQQYANFSQYSLNLAIDSYLYAGSPNIGLKMGFLLGMTLSAAGLLLLNRVFKESLGSQKEKEGGKSRNRVIEIHDYEILDDIQSRASEGYKVKIT
jgi:hypothetical protein